MKVNVDSNNIFAFWQSNEPIPAYLDLCKDTWIKNIPNCEIHILNHNNLHEYIDDIYDLVNLKKISFAMQSDIVSAAILEKFGGLFLDIDCIVIDDLFRIFDTISEEKLIAFGRPSAFAIHLAVLYCKKPNNPILAGWRAEAQRRLQDIPEKYDWSYFGNGIINPLLKEDNNKNSFIIERLISGNILETVVFDNEEVSQAISNYKIFYFSKFLGFNKNVLSLAKFGVISLHNSWTPPQYRAIKDKNEFLQLPIPISGMLNYVLKNDVVIDFNDTVIAIEIYLRNQLSQKNIPYQMKYLRQILVIDFYCQSLNFAFDITYQDSKIIVDLVLRNITPDNLKSHRYFIDNDIKFVNNKCQLGIYHNHNKDELLDNMLFIQKVIQELCQIQVSKVMVDDVYIDLLHFNIEEQILFIEGIAFIEYQSVKEYSDIDYQLFFVKEDGQVYYKKQLAKAHDVSITTRFSKNNSVNYDKCKFTTPKCAGIDISDIMNGDYQLYLFINTGKVKKTQPIRTLNNKFLNKQWYKFSCNDNQNTFIVGNINAIHEYSNKKIKIEGDYMDSKGNKIIAPKNLYNCSVEFLGGNNKLIIDNNANLKNCSFEMRENGKVIIKENVGFHGTIRVGHNCTVEIGNNTSSTNPVYVTVAEASVLKIGDDCMFATNNQIRTDDAHPIYDVNTGNRINPSKDVILGNHVWVGYGAMLFGGAKVGDGSVIGAGALVNKIHSNNCLVVGIPAKTVKHDIFWERSPLLITSQGAKNYTLEELQSKSYSQKTKLNN